MEIPGRKPSPDTEQPVRQADLGNRAWWCVVKNVGPAHIVSVLSTRPQSSKTSLVPGSDHVKRSVRSVRLGVRNRS